MEKGEWIMGKMVGNPKEEPMHYGEVFATWTYLLSAKSSVASYQTLVNHTGDEELRELLEEAIKISTSEAKGIATLLKKNGVPLPPAPPERPEANLEEIPVGARIMDSETVAMLAMSTSKGLVACSTIMAESIREDIGLMFGKFHMEKANFGLKVLRLKKEKGWLVHPPLHLHTAKE